MTSDKKRSVGLSSGDELYPVLPLRDIVVFPHMIVPLFVGREKSIRALEEVMRADKQILLATQMNAGDDDPVSGLGESRPAPVRRTTKGGSGENREAGAQKRAAARLQPVAGALREPFWEHGCTSSCPSGPCTDAFDRRRNWLKAFQSSRS